LSVPTTLPTGLRNPTWIGVCLAAVAIGSASCQALPPPERADAREGIVRAGSAEEARDVADALDALLPAVLSELPDAHARRLEVWVQREPAMYRFPPSSTYNEADGFFSDRLSRIHLRAGADDVRRTLAHELVHASLGASWRELPGTIEEGLCDVVATRLCPTSAPRLRAGRLLAAALALGGFDVEAPSSDDPPAADVDTEVRYVQHVFSPASRVDPIDPLDVFRSHAGRSTEAIPGDLKKALYGLAYLVAERIVDRRGLEGFHALVSGSRGRDRERCIEGLLGAAELTRDPQDWRRAISLALGPAEILEISRILPGIVLSTGGPREREETPGAGPVASRLDVRCGRR
jgi:hypothetical protein